jgi:DNA-binding LytR/AlgR family response regulator
VIRAAAEGDTLRVEVADTGAGLYENSHPGMGLDNIRERLKSLYGEWGRLISVNEIYYFRAQDKYTTVMTADTEYLIRKSIRELVGDLDPGQFWQIHRGTIVNVQKIDKVTREFSGGLMVRIKDLSGTLSISRAYSHIFKQM